MKTSNYTLLLLLGILLFLTNTSNAQILLSHDFDNGNLGPFNVCTTQNPNYSKVVNGRLKTWWTSEGYNGTRMDKGAEACGDQWTTYKEGWYGMNLELGADYPKNKKAGIAQIFGFIPGFWSWESMLQIEDGDLTIIHRSNGGSSSNVEEVVYPNFPYEQEVPIVIHFILSNQNKGKFEIWVDGVSKYKKTNINFGFGNFDGNDTKIGNANEDFGSESAGSLTVLKMGQYNFQDSEYDTNETRTVYYDDVSWYNGPNGYNIVNPGENTVDICDSHNAFTRIEAEDFCEQSGIQTGTTNSFVGWVNNGDWVQYENVDFGSGANAIEISASSGTSGGTIEIRQGSVSGTLLGTVEVTNTGSFTSWKTLTAGISPVNGEQDIYFVFTGGNGYLLDVDWFKFLEDTIVNPCNSPLADVTPPSDLIDGINYDYYEGSWNSLPNFSSLTPVSSGIASSIDLNNAASADNFGLSFNGYIYIQNEGSYTFYTTSDDGSSLWIDGTKVVDNDGLHAAREESGTVCLEAGYHKIEVQFFEKTGGNVLSASYEGPGITKQNISNLYGTSTTSECSIPWTDNDFTISDEVVNYSSGIIDISCASSSLEVSMDIEGIGSMENADYLNIYYTINGGSQQLISENVNAFSEKTVSVNDITGNTIEIIINGATSVASETYFISNISISEGTSNTLDQTISFGSLPTKEVGDSDFSPGATASSGLSVSYTSSNTNVATIVNGNIHIVSDGTSTITASQGGNNTYNAAPNVTQILTVYPMDNTNTITIQENTTGFCSNDGSIDNNHVGHTGTGFANTDNAFGNGINWKIDGTAGSYTISWRYASSSNRSAKLVVDGSTIANNISFNNTGNWTSWDTESVTVNLSAGVKDIRLEATNSSGLGNIDYMKVTGPNVAAYACTTIGGDCSDFFGGLSISQANPGCSNDNGRITINFEDSDAYTQIQLSIDGGNSYPITVNDNAGSYSFTGLGNAEYQVAARYAGGDCEYNVAHLILIKDCGDIPLNPGGVSWHDSYEANGFCWCSTNFDHNLGSKKVIVNGTQYSVVDICDELEKHPLFRSRNNGDNIYNDVQCGNGPINDSSDEPLCPGRVDMGVEGCLLRGVAGIWNGSLVEIVLKEIINYLKIIYQKELLLYILIL
ncbi:carbohydrate-binding protein [Aquimarina sp. 2201CG14-23]|uniref:carbohydrate-binding protein n=1 Tax=Aquimarina mycalae TaxID=3040073 RepID=UPI00247808D2|nr:carbohydrate-binding protein [Aquimarina sp. 2201CG14-23]MDH7445529.1 carbohydrate-binding protein [Aquimarina sp. 2201CG14-23]